MLYTGKVPPFNFCTGLIYLSNCIGSMSNQSKRLQPEPYGKIRERDSIKLGYHMLEVDLDWISGGLIYPAKASYPTGRGIG